MTRRCWPGAGTVRCGPGNWGPDAGEVGGARVFAPSTGSPVGDMGVSDGLAGMVVNGASPAQREYDVGVVGCDPTGWVGGLGRPRIHGQKKAMTKTAGRAEFREVVAQGRYCPRSGRRKPGRRTAPAGGAAANGWSRGEHRVVVQQVRDLLECVWPGGARGAGRLSPLSPANCVRRAVVAKAANGQPGTWPGWFWRGLRPRVIAKLPGWGAQGGGRRSSSARRWYTPWSIPGE